MDFSRKLSGFFKVIQLVMLFSGLLALIILFVGLLIQNWVFLLKLTDQIRDHGLRIDQPGEKI